MIKLMMEIKGVIPKRMRNQGIFAEKFFDQFSFVYIKDDGVFRLPISEIKKEKDLGVALEPSLQMLEQNVDCVQEVEKLQNLLAQCLELDPNERITPDLALKHPFLMKNTGISK